MGINEQPYFRLRILFKLLDHELIAANAGGPVNALHGVTSHILAHASRMRCNINRFAADGITAGQ